MSPSSPPPTFALADATFVNAPRGADVAAFPKTARLDNVMWRDGEQRFECSKRDDWPSRTPLDTTTALNGNVWIIFEHDGTWYANPIDWLRPGSTRKDLTRDDIATNSHIEGWAGPADGAVIGVMVSTLYRHNLASNGDERTPIVWVEYGTDHVVGTESPSTTDPTTEPSNPPTSTHADLSAAVSALATSIDLLTIKLASMHALLIDIDATTRATEIWGAAAAKDRRLEELTGMVIARVADEATRVVARIDKGVKVRF